MIGYIYKITNPSGKVYVGQTTNLKVRQDKYKYLNCKSQFRLYRSLAKYGWPNHVFEVLEEASVEKLDDLEVLWIERLNCFKSGLNCNLGGRGNKGYVISEELRLKMRNHALGRKQSKETIEKRVSKLIGKKRSEEFKENARQRMLGKSLSEETKKKLSDLNKGKKMSEEVKNKISDALRGRVVTKETAMKISESRRAGIARRKEISEKQDD
jgi:group I intron endonuclease